MNSSFLKKIDKIYLTSLCFQFQVHSTLGKFLKGGRDLDDMLIAAVIRNLKIVQVCKRRKIL